MSLRDRIPLDQIEKISDRVIEYHSNNYVTISKLYPGTPYKVSLVGAKTEDGWSAVTYLGTTINPSEKFTVFKTFMGSLFVVIDNHAYLLTHDDYILS